MNVASPVFALFAVCVALIQYAARNERWRYSISTVANALFVCSFAQEPLALLPLASFLVTGYVAIEWVRRHPSRWRPWLGFAAILLPYIYLKRFAFIQTLPALPFVYAVVGLSYVLFRLLHLLIDAGNGDLPERVHPLDYFNYSCNFPCFVSGPIQRYEDFLGDRLRLRDDPEPQSISPALGRIVTGFFKVTVASALADRLFMFLSPALFTDLAGSGSLSFVLRYGAAAAAYCAYLYYNFAGYTDIVIGAGVLIGQRLPENFDQPFRARSFLEFWSRWHMTLSNWFKCYLFNPLVGVLVQVFPSRTAVPYIGVLAFFITFLVMGVWHGTTGVFVIYGLLMGVGASINKLWQLILSRRLGAEPYRRLQEGPLYSRLARGLTCAYFCMGITCLWVDSHQLSILLSKLGAAGLIECLYVMSVFSALLLALADRAVAVGQRAVRYLLPDPSAALRFQPWMLAAQIILVIGVASLFHKAPEFVYKAF
jgi:D-alanyl-lipoteichoic acid acyltransferase DltB (MBOAT superfamily)